MDSEETFCKKGGKLTSELFWPNMAIGVYILHTAKSSSRGLSKQLPCESLPFGHILDLFGVKKTQRYGPLGPIFYTFLKVVLMHLEQLSCKSIVEITWKIEEKLTLT